MLRRRMSRRVWEQRAGMCNGSNILPFAGVCWSCSNPGSQASQDEGNGLGCGCGDTKAQDPWQGLPFIAHICTSG